MAVFTRHSPELHQTGENVHSLASVGSMTCVECGYAMAVGALEDLPRCPACGGSRFRHASIFEHPTVQEAAVEPASAPPSWLDDLRDLEAGVPRIAFEEEGEPTVVEMSRRWTRIGRSDSADLTLDDPTVSRRHAMVVRTADGGLRALDDRSLNGLFVNGERVEWAQLADGDELEIGCYRLYVIDPG